MKKMKYFYKNRDKNKDIWGLPGGALEIRESIEEAAIRETLEETGLIVKIKNLIGIYSKYFNEYPNRGKAQTICYSFKATIISGEVTVDNKETFGLKYFSKNNLPNIFVQQHTDMINDFFEEKKGY